MAAARLLFLNFAKSWTKLYSNLEFALVTKLYIPSTIKTDFIFWHTQWIVTAVKYFNGLNHWLFLSFFKFLN